MGAAPSGLEENCLSRLWTFPTAETIFGFMRLFSLGETKENNIILYARLSGVEEEQQFGSRRFRKLVECNLKVLSY
jgi:hypothetical protein